MVEDGNEAPDFEVATSGGGTLSLSKLKGKAVVLYFYPKDDTSGCTTEAKAFTGLADQFAALGTKIIGISPDSVASHKKFSDMTTARTGRGRSSIGGTSANGAAV